MALRISCGSHRQTARPNTTLPFSFVLMLVCAALIPITANGQTWSNPGSGTFKWEDPSNWSGGDPSSGQPTTFITNAVIVLGGSRSRSVSIDSTTSSGSISTMTINNLTISAPGSGNGASHNALFLNNAGTTTPLHILGDCIVSPNGAVNITDSILMIDGEDTPFGILALSVDGPVTLNPGGVLVVVGGEAVGASSQGTLTIAGGSNMVDELDIGLNPGSVGTVSLISGNLELPFVDDNHVLAIGRAGAGSLIQSGGTLETVFEYVGYSAAGTLTVAGGIHTVEKIDLSVGFFPGSTGAVWVTGGLLQPNLGIELGLSGPGALTQSNGVVQTEGEAVGSQSQGTLTIAGGAHIVGANGLTVGLFASQGTGTVWLTGGQLMVTNNGFSTSSVIGYAGVGRMTLSNGDWRTHSVIVAANGGSEGTLTVAGGTSTVYSNITVGDCASNAVGFVWVKGGDVFVTNATHDAVLDVRDGFFLFTAGQLVVDKLVMTNECGMFIHAGGTLSVGSVLLDPNLDADGDGLPNGWEQAHGLDPLSSMGNDGADGDPDGDGLSNFEEYQLGTDPLDRSSPYHITAIQREGSDVLVTWMTVNGKTNVLQSTRGTANGSYSNNFTDFSPQIIAPGCFCVASTNYLDVGGATNTPARYYRIRLVP
jgi:hypothetical protein